MALPTDPNCPQYSVAGVLDLRPAVGREGASDDAIVDPQHFHRAAITEASRDIGRTLDVGKHDRAKGCIDVCVAGRMLPNRTHELLDVSCVDLDDFVRDQPVRGAVNRGHRFAVRGHRQGRTPSVGRSRTNR